MGLRVTKGKGKRLKLQIRCDLSIVKSSIKVDLVDLVVPELAVNGFEIEHTLESEKMDNIEMELKIAKCYKSCQFTVTCQTAEGPLTANTVEFSTHDNGKHSKNEVAIVPNSEGVLSEAYVILLFIF